jgi:hypothetical protein
MLEIALLALESRGLGLFLSVAAGFDDVCDSGSEGLFELTR